MSPQPGRRLAWCVCHHLLATHDDITGLCSFLGCHCSMFVFAPEYVEHVAPVLTEQFCPSCHIDRGHLDGCPEPLVNDMAKSAHDAWWETYKKLGYASRRASWGEEFMVPFEELSETGKEFDRIIMRAILRAFAAAGKQVVDA